MPLQGLELLVTVLLAQNRQPPTTVAAGMPHAELAAELITLPSGLLAMVCEAIVKLKVLLGPVGLRVRVSCTGLRRGHRRPGARTAPFIVGAGAALASRGGPAVC